ncbi:MULTISPECIES: hypothetical protein [Paenibacillus]|uniref:Amidase n=1 Tax=Paenibacillus cucumis (ex Kampfer et al. 2016) TaxID=1776858 RepID=A0ABS7KN24_9BACL|nr:hypothetical protein [Paenibacillus cucumis (ex Kampfer et al. 2016)]MBY0205347.1 hypothetical protein [Paenibacillus cucumis (ex Kampfer et al. 2016)]MDP9698594.1 hypothetical protein [Paenibacillus intestini]
MKTKKEFRFILLMSCLVLCLSTACSTRVDAVGSVEPVDSYATIHGKLDRPVRGTWVWDTTQIRNNAQDILSFAKANNINTIYLQMNRDIKIPEYKNFIRLARAQNIAVDIMDGRSAWGLTESREQIASFMDWIEAYQAQALANEKFAGIHLDIEPHVHPQWKINQASVITQWQGNVNYIVDRAARMKMPVAADLPFWLDNYKIPGSTMAVSSWMIRKFDSITIMAYRDTAAAIYNVAKDELIDAASVGKKISIAVETKQSKEGDFITFYEEGDAYMEEQLKLVEKMASAHASFNGFSVHEYSSWKTLRK